MKSLTEIANSIPIDKGTTHGPKHGYTEFYDHYFKNIRNDELLILEIGVSGGGSLELWYKYFPKSRIIALDIIDESHLSNDRVFVFQLDQSSEVELENFVNSCKENGYIFDIIIDDGSHHFYDQQLSMGYLFPLLKPKGLYIIEDLHTSIAAQSITLYGKKLDIQNYRKNTTLTFLSGPFYSQYLNQEKNDYLMNNIGDIIISNKFNEFNDNVYNNRSITSVIKKK